GIDPERIALLGLSAGAHLAVLAHVVRDLPPELPPELRDVPETVRAVVAHYGPYDLFSRRSEMVDALLGPRVEDSAWASLAPPITQAAHAAWPVLLIHGTGDRLVSWRESERMHGALQEAGKTSELLLLEGAPHAFQIDWRGEANRRANAAMDTFLDRHL